MWFRATPAEKARIAARALAAGQKLPDFIRARCLGEKPVRVNPTVLAAGIEHETVAEEVAEAKLEDPSARDAFIARRALQLKGEGRTTLVARREALREWEAR
jgi:hypothetical protein